MTPDGLGRGAFRAILRPATTKGVPETMPRTFATAAVAAALLAAPAAAQAPAHVTDVRSVSDLAAVCDPRIQGVERLESIAYCQGFVTAAAQYHTSLHPAGGTRNPMYCLPNPPPTVAQSGLGFAAWARQNPQHANEPALDGLLRWAQSTYPCPPPGNAAESRERRARPAAAAR